MIRLLSVLALGVAILPLTPTDAAAFNFMEWMQNGGEFMWLILAAAVFGFAIIGERTFALFMSLHVDPESFFESIREKVLKGDIKGAIAVCDEKEKAALSRVLKAALLRADQPERIMQDAVDEADLEVLPLLQARTPYLSVIANVSTLMGLLGTILGLIAAFNGLAFADPSQKQTVLANGIAIAMNTTAFGLIAAIPCMVGHAVLMGRTNTVVGKIDEYAVKLINLLIGLQRKKAA